MRRTSVRLIAACVATAALAFTVADIETNARAKSRLERLLAGRSDVTVASIAVNLLTGRLTLSGLAAGTGPWRVTIERLEVPVPDDTIALISAARAFPLGGSSEEKAGVAAPPSATGGGSASAENVVLTNGPTTYRLKRIDLAGTPLGNDDLAALLDPAKPDTVEARLRKVTAASITIPELTADSLVGASEQHWVQKQILLANVTQGKAAIGSVGASRVAAKDGDNASTIEIGSLQGAAIDMAQTAHVFAARRADDAEKLLPMADSVIANAIKSTDLKNGQSVTIGSIKQQGLMGRAFKTDLRTQSGRLSTAKPGDPAVDAFFSDFLSSVSAKLVEIDDVAAVPSASAEPADTSTFGVEQISLSDIGEGHRDGAIAVRNVHFEGKPGRMSLARVDIGGVFFPSPRPAAELWADGSHSQAEPARSLMPRIAKLALSDLHFNMNVAGKDEAEQRIDFAVDRIDYSASGLDGGRIPAKGAATIAHATYDVPPKDPSMQTLRSLGYTRLDVSSSFANSYDAKRQTMAIDKFALDGVDMGSVEIKLDLGNVSDKIMSQNPEVQKASAIAVLFKDADLVIRNDGLIDKALKYRADADGKSVDDEKKACIDFVTNQLSLMAGGSPKLKPLEDALATFIAKPKTLHVAIGTKNGLGIADMGLLGDPIALLDQLTIQADAND